MPTIEDVAKLAGLSRTTVSRVINNHPYVSEDKRKLVIEAMEQLGYVPNSSARSLRSQKTDVIALFVPRIMNPFFSHLVESMEIAAAEHGYQLIICQTRYSAEKELNYMNLLKMKQVDGVILASMQNDWNVIEPFLNYGPIILCNEFDEQANVPSVMLDQVEGGYIATKHLLEQGHRRIAYCQGGARSNVASYRERGFRKALAEYKIEFNEQYAFRNVFHSEGGRRVFHEMMALSEPPTAVFTGSDEVAAGIISEANKHGCSIPEQLAVVGFDNQEITELIEPTITTVYQPVEQMAQKALEIMVEKIHSRKYRCREVYEFPLELIVRESTVSSNKLVTL
ncbi:LacI family DNA-binding transcriptional regulator [Anoxybacillus rupiensis]|jgi:LacI family transcriptional regulator, repressor for deo operon, udp, cdd, tsx, nupC, and nupG|uniref:LacI family DNA-binding transcriptional regulator n=1 Tax=Anoxybacteroides rupiense TaxID=311460 RepID=A0ABD5IVI0_9BACL|nr:MULTISPECIES: LacI family DNA-binding transcriptional regulator [Anoxybacillus]KXG10082.1 Catabolite control protein A [Anoxybacillus sp. P3H1B]MBB3907587.1 DNA-binding LacI/PurR family transcriptional regulator [Anoxybacillus rupiensis]MBS2771748.1 LacI family DNA-binding transcriptional regulator [Anoxybacillus rupiensis]MDE8564159.1 LacI family DNA-binding transcriptional regulator [Anoxybacillus rupiensis]MED5051790.1 LacI family DNA-binding transcriptional regulator [Anoxybacillus rupi